MRREELEQKVLDIVTTDMQHLECTDEELLEEIKKASDDDLIKFLRG